MASSQADILREIGRPFGLANPTKSELVPLAYVLADKLGKPLPRDAKRKKCALLAWFGDNAAGIAPWLPRITLGHSAGTAHGGAAGALESCPPELTEYLSKNQASSL